MSPTAPARPSDPLPWLAAMVACGLPTLLAFNLPPSATLLNQCLAVAAWGAWVVVQGPRRWHRGIWPVQLALALVAAAALWSFTMGGLPASLGWSALASLAAGSLMLTAGADAMRRPDAANLVAAFMAGLLLAGLLSALVALVQVFAPAWTDGQWLASSGLPGRAVGNLRQPNHLCSLLLWAMVAAVALHAMGRLGRWALGGAMLLLVFAVELSASRTGAAGLAVLLLWGLFDRRLPRTARLWLLALPMVYGLAYAAMAWYGDWSHAVLGAQARVAGEQAADALGAAGSANNRPNIWRTAWALVLANPLKGVGFGEFNLAWSLTAFSGRPTAFFDHTHNLPLQLAVELGLPLTLLVLALLTWALWSGWRRTAQAGGAMGVAARGLWVIVLLVALHSQVEYPIWYTYFLLPTALAWGMVLAAPDGDQDAPHDAAAPKVRPAEASRRSRTVWPHWGVVAGALMLLGGAFAVRDYLRVVVIYAPQAGAGPLAQRTADGQKSLFFAHHADYAAATNDLPATPSPAALALRELAFARAPHSLMDTRLMIAWSQHLHAHGQTDLARWLAARVRDFRHADSAEFFAACARGDSGAFQCQAPLQPHDWREFLVRPEAGRR